jgi:hypothetical protein
MTTDPKTKTTEADDTEGQSLRHEPSTVEPDRDTEGSGAKHIVSPQGETDDTEGQGLKHSG